MPPPMSKLRPPAITSRSAARSVAAIVGLTLSLTTMWMLGLGGVGYGFLFGASGAVIGGMTGERAYDWQSNR